MEEVLPEEVERVSAPDIREQILKAFREIGFTYVCVDLKGYRTGAMNEVLK